jgi:hypothetical protein
VEWRDFAGGVAPAESSRGTEFFAVWVGTYLEEAPALRAVGSLQKEGLTAFSVQKTLVEKKLPFNQPIGAFHLVLAGLFGEREDAQRLGRRMLAQGLISNFQVIPADSPGEFALFQTQSAPQERRADQVAASAQERVGRPLPADSPAATGEGFKTVTRGRYVGSYRDVMEARAEARRLSSAGWPAAVEEAREGGGMWYRVYLAEAGDSRDFRANPQTLAAARATAGRQKGLVILVDSSGLKGVWGMGRPNQKRTDASSCASYSQAGRLLTVLERFVGFIPDAPTLVALKPLAYNPPASFFDRVARPVKSWWTEDDSAYANPQAAYGLAIYNRPELLKSLRNLKVDVRSAPVGPGLSNFPELNSIPGRKTVVLFSDFAFPEREGEAAAALGRLKGGYGDDLEFFVVYGDADDRGYRTAQELAKAGGGGEAWNGCLLLADNAYFEKFVKRVFSR